MKSITQMSLNLRIILSATLVLVIFISLVAAALDRAFIDSTESALRDKLTSQLYVLLAAAEVDDQGINMPSSELDALLGLPSSGVYAFITNQSGSALWQSSSVLGATPPEPLFLKSGIKRFSKTAIADKEYYTYAYGVNWATDNQPVALTFNISTDLKSFNKQINQYRTTLWGWLLAMALLLLISMGSILRWGLSPLRLVGTELSRIESGKQTQIQQSYPEEIEQLTRNINVLLQQEHKQKTRYRNALGDLAHSLKTPLAVLQSGLSKVDTNEEETAMQEQVTRMNSIVEYQLQRAATAGSTSIGKSVNIKELTDRILKSLKKVYHEKPVSISLNIEKDLIFKGDEGDMMELLGNLLDNAYKWTVSNIDIKATSQQNRLCLQVSDNGPGIEQDQVEKLLQRGTRADQATPGHGIGLSIIGNIVDAYQGQLNIDNNPGGGALISITL